MRNPQITMKNERPNVFPLRLGTRKGCLLLQLLHIVLEGLARAIRQEKKSYMDQKGRRKTTSVDDMILYIENPKESI